MRTLKTILALLPLGFVWLSGCNKSGDCFKNTGTIIMEERRVGDFDSIDVRDYVNIILTQDSTNKVVVEAGQNIISGITTEVVSNQLNIDNTLKCNWLRSYSKPINVYISVKNLQKIYYLGTGNVTSTNTLKSPKLKLDISGGCGTFDLDLDAHEGDFTMQLGTATIKLHGTCSNCSIYQADYGTFQCSDLRTTFNQTTNKGSNDCYINVSNYLYVVIGSIGNIYFTGNPDSVKTKINGAGQLIHF